MPATLPDGRPRFLKRVLITFWVVQIFISAIFVLALAYDISTVNIDDATETADQKNKDRASYIYGIFFLGAIPISINLTEIVLFARKKLRPIYYLIANVVNGGITLGVFLSGIIRNTKQKPTVFLSVMVIVGVFLILSFLSTFIYSAVVYYRQKKWERARKRHTNASWTTSLESHGAAQQRHSKTSGTATMPYQPYQPYQPYHPAYGMDDTAGLLSWKAEMPTDNNVVELQGYDDRIHEVKGEGAPLIELPAREAARW